MNDLSSTTKSIMKATTTICAATVVVGLRIQSTEAFTTTTTTSSPSHKFASSSCSIRSISSPVGSILLKHQLQHQQNELLQRQRQRQRHHHQHERQQLTLNVKEAASDGDEEDVTTTSSSQNDEGNELMATTTTALEATGSSSDNNENGGAAASTTINSNSSPFFESPDPTTTSTLLSSSSSSSFKFGDVVRLDQRPKGTPSVDSDDNDSIASTNTNINEVEEKDPQTILQERKRRNVSVAILSIVAAIFNYIWQWTHPVTPIQLLVSMQQQSSPINVIGNTEKPTVIDFWAPWCENCKYMAPTLYQIEESYRDRVNFVMVNADNLEENWPLIEALGVDAIPHLALLEADGTVDTALIGPVPKEWLSTDLDVLIENAQSKPKSFVASSYKPLPYQMLDVFANKSPEQRRIHVEQQQQPSQDQEQVQQPQQQQEQ